MNRRGLLLVLLVLALGSGPMRAADRKPLGEIDFFGDKGFDLAAIRSSPRSTKAIPSHPLTRSLPIP